MKQFQPMKLFYLDFHGKFLVRGNRAYSLQRHEEIVLIAHKNMDISDQNVLENQFLFCLYNYRKGVNPNPRGKFAILQFHYCYIRLNNSFQIKNAGFYRCFRS